MIVKIQASGKSFSGLATYLTHDLEHAKTAERVAWTHTHNLADENVPVAVNEMFWTAHDAEQIKQEAGVRAGRPTESPVWHCSLNWAPDERPTREHMVETAEEFLRHMKYDQHQAIFIGHQDKHPHLHIMLNAVHPETGLRLDDSFERRRAQEWALQYEREHGIYCEQRLLNPEEREKSMPRNIWMAFRESEKEIGNSEKLLRENDGINFDPVKNRRDSEWDILKEHQRLERVDHFNSGKSEFKELRNFIYREIRDDFRERWSEYYAAGRNGTDPDALTEMKAKLVAGQKAALDGRRDEACKELRASRDARYRELLGRQQDARDDLYWRQELGVDNAAFLSGVVNRDSGGDIASAFRSSANEVTKWPSGREVETTAEVDAAPADTGHEAARGRGGDDIGIRSPFSVGSVLGSFASFLLNGGDPPPPPPRPNRDLFLAAAEDTAKREQHEREEAEEEARQKQRSPQ